MYQHVTLKQMRPRLPALIGAVDERLARFVISKRGEPVAVLLSIDDYESMLETLNEISDRAGLMRIRKGLKESRLHRTVAWKSVKARHHL